MNIAAITTVISFCTNDYRLLKACVEQAHRFSNHIIITVCDHFFDGTLENYALLEHVYHLFPECQFIEYAFDSQESYHRFTPYYPEHHNWRHVWHNTGRWISYYFLPQECAFICFLDSDEIIDGDRFLKWIEENGIASYSALSFSSYWYFREAKYQATKMDDTGVLINRKALLPDYLWHVDERSGILMRIGGKGLCQVKGKDQKPLMHHYSWVRTKEELHKKFSTWGHYWERPWDELLEKEFSAPFLGKDFTRGYVYRTVQAYFDPLTVEIPEIAHISLEQHLKNMQNFPNVIKVDRNEMLKREILHCL